MVMRTRLNVTLYVHRLSCYTNCRTSHINPAYNDPFFPSWDEVKMTSQGWSGFGIRKQITKIHFHILLTVEYRAKQRHLCGCRFHN